MGMPEIPDGKNRPCGKDVAIDLLESIALQEMALAHLLNAQGESLQGLVSHYRCDAISHTDLHQGTKQLNRTLDSVIMQEWLLVKKLHEVQDFMDKNPGTGGKVCSHEPAGPKNISCHKEHWVDCPNKNAFIKSCKDCGDKCYLYRNEEEKER